MTGTPALPPLFLGTLAVGGIRADFDRAYAHLAKVGGSSFILPVRILDRERMTLISRSHAQLVGGWHPSLTPRCNEVLGLAGENTPLWTGITGSGFLTLTAAQIATQSGTLWCFAAPKAGAPAMAAGQERAGSDLAVKWIAIHPDRAGPDDMAGCVPGDGEAPSVDLAFLARSPEEPVRIALCGRDLAWQSTALGAARRALPAGCSIEIHVATDRQGQAEESRDLGDGAGQVRVIGVEPGDAWRDYLARDWDIVIAGEDFRPSTLPLRAIRMRALLLPAPRLAGRIAFRQDEAQPSVLREDWAASPGAMPVWYVHEAAPGAPFRIAATDYRQRVLVPMPVAATDPVIDLMAACHALAAVSSRAGFIHWAYTHARAVIPLVSERGFRNFFTLFALARTRGDLLFDAGLRLETGIAILDWLHECPPAELRERAYRLFLGRAYDGTDMSELTDDYPMTDRVKLLREVLRSGRCGAHIGAWRQACLLGTIERLSAHMDARALYDDAKIGRYIRFVGLEGGGKIHKTLELEDLVIASSRRYRA